ncbi:hypothetical protein CPB85DRAFT_1267853 [Mucidula mucida]|nr:hypothetical protein CPB85DRAFT_1267853 [Mucidula mucida]
MYNETLRACPWPPHKQGRRTARTQVPSSAAIKQSYRSPATLRSQGHRPASPCGRRVLVEMLLCR